MQARLEQEQPLFKLFNYSQCPAGFGQRHCRDDKCHYDNHQKQQNQTFHKMSCCRSLL